jgi:hypothetical protein
LQPIRLWMTNSCRHVSTKSSPYLPTKVGFKALGNFFIRRLLNLIIFIYSLRLPFFKYFSFVERRLTLILLRFVLSYFKHLSIFLNQYMSFLLSCNIDNLMRWVEPIGLIATNRPWSFQNHFCFGVHKLVVPRVLPLFLPLHFPWHHFAGWTFE